MALTIDYDKTHSSARLAVLADGTLSAPALTFANDPDSGIYRIGANNIGISVNGAKVLDIATTGLAVTGALSATTGLTVNDGNNGAFQIGALTTRRIIGGSDYTGIWLDVPTGDSIAMRVNAVVITATSSTGLAVTGALTATTGFGCNGASAQTAYASGGAATDAATTQTLANNIRLALIANGIMS